MGQVFGTVLILAFVPGSALQTAALFSWWALTLLPLSRSEWFLVGITCASFFAADLAVLHRGIFVFTHQDIVGMPYYEPFVWGFFFLNASRMTRSTLSGESVWPGVLFAVAVFLVSGFTPGEAQTLALQALLLGIGLLVFRTKNDWLFALYLLVMGLSVEWVGTTTHQWYYQIQFPVLWWVLTWATSGLILSRAVVPVSRLAARIFAR